MNILRMTNPTPTPNPETQSKEAANTLPGPLRCLTGAMISGGLAIALYSLTSSIAQSFASKPPPASSMIVLKIAIAVRTLVVGVSSLATFIFAFVTIGLVALAIQVSFQRLTNRAQ